MRNSSLELAGAQGLDAKWMSAFGGFGEAINQPDQRWCRSHRTYAYKIHRTPIQATSNPIAEAEDCTLLVRRKDQQAIPPGRSFDIVDARVITASIGIQRGPGARTNTCDRSTAFIGGWASLSVSEPGVRCERSPLERGSEIPTVMRIAHDERR